MPKRFDFQMADGFHERGGVAPRAKRLMVCIGPGSASANLVRATQRLAEAMHAPWLAVHVETPFTGQLSEDDRQRLAETLHLAEQLGGETAELSGQEFADEVFAYAQSHNVTSIVVANSQKPRWRDWLGGSPVYELTRKSRDIDVYVISGESKITRLVPRAPTAARSNRMAYVGALIGVALCTGLGFLMFPYFAPANIIMVYLLGVVVISLRFGRGPSLLTSVLGTAAFDFFFVPPYWTFVVEDSEYLLVFAVMLGTGLIISTLTARVRFQVESARHRERRTAALYAMSRDLVRVTSLENVIEYAAWHISQVFDADVFLLLPHEDPFSSQATTDEIPSATHLVPLQAFSTTGELLGEREHEAAHWTFQTGENAGTGTDAIPTSHVLFVPMPEQRRRVGVLGVRPRVRTFLPPDQVRLLETFAGQIALAIVRIQLTQLRVRRTSAKMKL